MGKVTPHDTVEDRDWRDNVEMLLGNPNHKRLKKYDVLQLACLLTRRIV